MSLIAVLAVVVVTSALVAALAPEVMALLRGRHFAGVHRYLHDDAADPMRPGDRAWVRSIR